MRIPASHFTRFTAHSHISAPLRTTPPLLTQSHDRAHHHPSAYRAPCVAPTPSPPPHPSADSPVFPANRLGPSAACRKRRRLARSPPGCLASLLRALARAVRIYLHHKRMIRPETNHSSHKPVISPKTRVSPPCLSAKTVKVLTETRYLHPAPNCTPFHEPCPSHGSPFCMPVACGKNLHSPLNNRLGPSTSRIYLSQLLPSAPKPPCLLANPPVSPNPPVPPLPFTQNRESPHRNSVSPPAACRKRRRLARSPPGCLARLWRALPRFDVILYDLDRGFV